MIEDIVTILKGQISTLAFIDKIGGIVKPLIIKKVTEGTINKTIPVCFNSTKAVCNTSDYTDYCPNTNYKSVSYFEIKDINETDSNSKYVTYEGQLRFTCWLNLPKINGLSIPISNIPFEALGVITRQINNSSPFAFAQITKIDITRDENIFSPYTYDEAENQYLIYPFDFFALDITVTFRVPYACINNVAINPNSCW